MWDDDEGNGEAESGQEEAKVKVYVTQHVPLQLTVRPQVTLSAGLHYRNFKMFNS